MLFGPEQKPHLHDKSTDSEMLRGVSGIVYTFSRVLLCLFPGFISIFDLSSCAASKFCRAEVLSGVLLLIASRGEPALKTRVRAAPCAPSFRFAEISFIPPLICRAKHPQCETISYRDHHVFVHFRLLDLLP